MTTWRSRALLATLPALALAGCDEDGGPIFGTSGARPVTTMTLAQGEVVVAAPPGYCFDPRSSASAIAAGFALAARCDTLGSEEAGGWRDPAILAVTAAPLEGQAAPTAADLARSAAPAQIRARRDRGGLAMIALGAGAPALPGGARLVWRATYVEGTHLVGLGLYAPPGSPAEGADGAALLETLALRSRAATAAEERS